MSTKVQRGSTRGQFVSLRLTHPSLATSLLSRWYTNIVDTRPSDEFYALFYLGLHCEARGETTKASQYMLEAIQSEYANSIGRGDYMTSVARVRQASV